MNQRNYNHNNTKLSGHRKFKIKASLSTRRRCTRESLPDSLLKIKQYSRLRNRMIFQISTRPLALVIRQPTDSHVNNSSDKLVSTVLSFYRSSSWTPRPRKNRNLHSSEVSQHHRTRARAARSPIILELNPAQQGQCRRHRCKLQRTMGKWWSRRIRRILCSTNRISFRTSTTKVNSRSLWRQWRLTPSSSRKKRESEISVDHTKSSPRRINHKEMSLLASQTIS